MPRTLVVALVAVVLLGAVALLVAARRRRDTDLVGSQLAQRRAAVAPTAPLEERVADCLRRGRKIEAIKIYREATGTSLADAKRAVEQFEIGRELRPSAAPPPTPPSARLDDAAWQRMRELVRRGQKIQAIKVYRELTGEGLRDAKDAIDRL
jgi:ribosomal protein L7/L12